MRITSILLMVLVDVPKQAARNAKQRVGSLENCCTLAGTPGSNPGPSASERPRERNDSPLVYGLVLHDATECYWLDKSMATRKPVWRARPVDVMLARCADRQRSEKLTKLPPRRVRSTLSDGPGGSFTGELA